MNGFPIDFLPIETLIPLLVRATAAATSLALVVAVVCLLAGRWIGPRQRAALWLIVAMRLALPVAPEFGGSLQFLLRQNPEPAGELNVTVTASQRSDSQSPAGDSVDSPASYTVPSTELDLEEMLITAIVIVGIVGTVAAAGMVLWSDLYWWLRLRGVASSTDPRLLGVLQRCREQSHLRRRVEIAIVPNLQIPAVTGVFRPRILLPEDVARDFSDAEIEHILLHELAHVKRHDLAVNHFLSVLQMMHWWNPVYWFVRRQLVKERELACDESVVQLLGGETATQYGRTLLRIVERLTDARERLWHPVIGGAGLITLLGRRSALETRLRRLPSATQLRSRMTRVFAWSLVLLAALSGLTDAEQPPATNSSSGQMRGFLTPFGARFHIDSEPTSTPDEQLIVAAYKINDILQLLEKEKMLSREGAQKYVEGLIPISDPLDPTKPRGVWDQPDTLIVRAPQGVHKSLRRTLEIWRAHGIQQISIEVRFIDAEMDVIERAGISGGEIYSGMNRRDSLFWNVSDDPTGEMKARSETTTSSPLPLYLKRMDDELALNFMKLCQNHPRSNVLFAPKVTIFAGQEAQISDEVRRPLVVGLRSVEQASHQDSSTHHDADGQFKKLPQADSDKTFLEPEIVEIADGRKMRVSAYRDSKTALIRLNWEVVESRITDIYTGTVRQGEGKNLLTVQIPSVARRVCAASATIKSGETLLLHPIKAASEGERRTYMMITPRVVEPAE